MIGSSALFAAVAVALIGAVTEASPPQKIVATSAAYPGELPYQVSIRYQGRHQCGGAIITKRHILTSASCAMTIANIYNAVVVTGSINVNEGQTHKIKSIVHHAAANHAPPGGPQDIAIISVFAIMSFNKWQNMLYLPSAPAPSQCLAIVSGWSTKNNPNHYGPNLSKAEVQTLSDLECHNALQSNNIKWGNQLCSYSSAGVGMCLGDEGAPLVVNGVLVGIVSGTDMCRRGYPNVYTSVWDNLQWVNYQIKAT